MAFTDKQARALKAKLARQHVKTRLSQGTTLSYLEGWHVIAEANRIFGHDAWDRTTLSPRCVWSELQRGQTVCFYSTRARITVRAGDIEIVREGIGTGIGRSSSPEVAHEIALKAAETDATKRALATFGNPFGLALYDKDQTGVTKPPKAGDRSPEPGTTLEPVVFKLQLTPDTSRTYTDARAFIEAVNRAIPEVETLDALYAFWHANLEAFTLLRRHAPNGQLDPLGPIIQALKERARALGRDVEGQDAKPQLQAEPPPLAIPKEKRIRDKAHLAFVGRQPCMVCGRTPAHAHHLRFAQARGMGLKVSDEFTVPLCSVHHDALHRTGDEPAWWARHGILDPLEIAAKLWRASRTGTPADDLPPPGSGPAANGAEPSKANGGHYDDRGPQ